MTEQEKFSYEGTLVFNGLYRTEAVSQDEELEQEQVEELTEFEKGTPGTEKSGFVGVDLSSYFDRYESLNNALKKTADEISAHEFRTESYNRPDELVDEEGDPTDGWARSTSSAYFYWDDPEYGLLQGSHGKVDDLKTRMHEDWGTDVDLNPLTLEPDFLLYLLEKYDSDERIKGISISTLADVKMSGSVPEYGTESEVRNSLDATSALPVIAGVLLNYDIREMEGRFSFEDFDITANLQTDVRDYTTGRIHVKVENDIENNPKLIRLLLSLYFVRRLVELYDEWREMEPEEKYVSPEFFAKLHRRATDLEQSAEFDFPLKERVQDYADKREEAGEWELSELDWGSHENGQDEE